MAALQRVPCQTTRRQKTLVREVAPAASEFFATPLVRTTCFTPNQGRRTWRELVNVNQPIAPLRWTGSARWRLGRLVSRGGESALSSGLAAMPLVDDPGQHDVRHSIRICNRRVEAWGGERGGESCAKTGLPLPWTTSPSRLRVPLRNLRITPPCGNSLKLVRGPLPLRSAPSPGLSHLV